jgi:SAM-dependent methyltransferase
MDLRGDSERQAILRDGMIKRRGVAEKDIFVSRIDSMLEPGMKICDIGCGTGHIIQELANRSKESFFVGLDISHSMLEIATRNSFGLSNVHVLKGDGLSIPFADNSLDVVIARLAPYSPEEVYRVLGENGHFLDYGLGPEANKEVLEFFPDRIDRSSFFFPKDLMSWKEEISQVVEGVGFTVREVKDHIEVTHQSEEDLMDLIEMVPLVEDFDREKDRKMMQKIAEKYGDSRGIQNTWHYCITMASKR